MSIAAVSHRVRKVEGCEVGSLVVGGRLRSFLVRRLRRQTLKNHSGMPTRYFKSKIQRPNILSGTRPNHSNMCIIVW